MEKETIFIVEHGCGWGPYRIAYFKTYEKAKEFFDHFIMVVKRKENYIIDSMSEPEIPEKALYPKSKLRISWKVEIEYNNESGHEFDEQDEFLEINEEELQ